MFTDSLTLFDQTIDNLQTLAAVLSDELDERVHAVDAGRETAAYRAAHSRIGALLPALRAARIAQEESARFVQRSICLNCD